jgi:hypothetical protein
MQCYITPEMHHGKRQPVCTAVQYLLRLDQGLDRNPLLQLMRRRRRIAAWQCVHLPAILDILCNTGHRY